MKFMLVGFLRRVDMRVLQSPASGTTYSARQGNLNGSWPCCGIAHDLKPKLCRKTCVLRWKTNIRKNADARCFAAVCSVRALETFHCLHNNQGIAVMREYLRVTIGIQPYPKFQAFCWWMMWWCSTLWCSVCHLPSKVLRKRMSRRLPPIIEQLNQSMSIEVRIMHFHILCKCQSRYSTCKRTCTLWRIQIDPFDLPSYKCRLWNRCTSQNAHII